MYPRRLGAWRWEAAPSLRPVNTERAEAQRHGGFQKLACTHLCNIPPDFIVLAKARKCTKREGRACRGRWGGRTPTGCGRAGARPSRVLDLYDNPIISRPLSIRSFPVPLQWVKQRASQPQNQSPCPRASARSVLTGRRPRDVPAPPRRMARKGGTSRNREAVPPWMGSSDHTTSLAPSRFSATRRGGAGTSRTYTTQPPFPHRFFQSTAASRAMSRR